MDLSEDEVALVLRCRMDEVERGRRRALADAVEAARDPVTDPRPGDTIVVRGERNTVRRVLKTRFYLAVPTGRDGLCWVGCHRLYEWRTMAARPDADVRKRPAGSTG